MKSAVERSPSAPELMAPAGDWDCVRAAVENGADAVYFGLRGGLNARARAVNFAASELPGLMAFLHVRGVQGYLTLNTLVFREELERAEQAAREAIAAGVDAVLVQDLGLLGLLHRLCPDLPLHASTQMTLSSAECIGEVEPLGVRRVVLPRELSIAEIAALHGQTGVELEAFVHGALCISYSGQCLASLSLGGRSANRGQCAQPCRLPYTLVCDGRSMTEPPPATTKPRPPVAPNSGTTAGPSGATGGRGFVYPMSPHDLAAHDRVAELIAAGVSALKIEGRLKPAEYVASVTRFYRAKIDSVVAARLSPLPLGEGTSDELAEIEAAFSRGFCRGWLDGPNDRALVSGTSSAKRGTYLGEVQGNRGARVLVRLAAPVQRGDGLVFEGDRSRGDEIGGRVYEVFQDGRSMEGPVAGGLVELAFRHGAVAADRLRTGQKVWKTDDPRLDRRLRKSYTAGQFRRRVPVDLVVEAAVGSPMVVRAATATGAACRVVSPEPLPEAVKHPLSVETLVEQFGRLGNTPYELGRLDARLGGRAMCPLSVLGTLRREMVRGLEACASRPPERTMCSGLALAALRAEINDCKLQIEDCKLQIDVAAKPDSTDTAARPHPSPLAKGEGTVRPQLHVLCRSMEHVTVALERGVSSIVADLLDLRDLDEAVRAARDGGAAIWLASPRIHKPDGSEPLERLLALGADGIVARNLAALGFCRQAGLPAAADFSLNAVNDLAVAWLVGHGACRVTAAYDLNREQLLELASAVDPRRLEVIVYGHVPMFHTEYCLFCRTLSPGRGRSDCGRQCLRHKLRLRDRRGVEHPVIVDSECRNTVFHGQARDLSDAVPALLARGVQHYRIELPPACQPRDVRRIIAGGRKLFG